MGEQSSLIVRTRQEPRGTWASLSLSLNPRCTTGDYPPPPPQSHFLWDAAERGLLAGAPSCTANLSAPLPHPGKGGGCPRPHPRPGRHSPTEEALSRGAAEVEAGGQAGRACLPHTSWWGTETTSICLSRSPSPTLLPHGVQGGALLVSGGLPSVSSNSVILLLHSEAPGSAPQHLAPASASKAPCALAHPSLLLGCAHLASTFRQLCGLQ